VDVKFVIVERLIFVEVIEGECLAVRLFFKNRCI
jgi:hypothetical protein